MGSGLDRPLSAETRRPCFTPTIAPSQACGINHGDASLYGVMVQPPSRENRHDETSPLEHGGPPTSRTTTSTPQRRRESEVAQQAGIGEPGDGRDPIARKLEHDQSVRTGDRRPRGRQVAAHRRMPVGSCRGGPERCAAQGDPTASLTSSRAAGPADASGTASSGPDRSEYPITVQNELCPVRVDELAERLLVSRAGTESVRSVTTASSHEPVA